MLVVRLKRARPLRFIDLPVRVSRIHCVLLSTRDKRRNDDDDGKTFASAIAHGRFVDIIFGQLTLLSIVIFTAGVPEQLPNSQYRSRTIDGPDGRGSRVACVGDGCLLSIRHAKSINGDVARKRERRAHLRAHVTIRVVKGAKRGRERERERELGREG